MLKKIGTAIFVLAVGTSVIAWSQRAPQGFKGSSVSVDAAALHAGSGHLQVQKISDLSFVYADEY
jgi:hypothetical protein